MELKQILQGIDGIKAKGNIDIDIPDITNDSRKVEKGSMFIAVKGFETDGHKYLKDVIEKGAKVVMVQEGADIKEIIKNDDITILMVPDTRKALAKVSCNFYDNPSKKFVLVGVTGTKGKTTTTFMIKHMLEKEGKKVGLIGTIATYINGKRLSDSARTTPESIELQKTFAEMVKQGVEVCVMEVSSQSLKYDRVYGCEFDIGVFTNFSEDHISPKEHPNMEDYFESKTKLFDMCKIAYVNTDDIYGCKLVKMHKCETRTYGIDNAADLLAKDITITNSYADFRVKLGMKNERVKCGIPGRFSVYNSLAAISVCQKLNVGTETIKEALEEVRVPGRSELVDNKKEITIMIDYAHSPESLQNILSATAEYTGGRVISVFGCGGDRDSGKRPIMGEISGRIADYTIITSDNPRTEKPEEIIKQIEAGIKKTNAKYECIVDRREAIKKAIEIANKRDIIVLAGKGHEQYQEINGKAYPFDERAIIKEIIDGMGK